MVRHLNLLNQLEGYDHEVGGQTVRSDSWTFEAQLNSISSILEPKEPRKIDVISSLKEY